MGERRANYRRFEGLDSIRVLLVSNDDDCFDCALMDLSSRGAALAITMPAPQVLDLAEGADVRLRFEIEDKKTISDLRAVVRNVRGSDTVRVLGLEFLDWRKLHESLPPSYFSVFNRRRHFRVIVPQQHAPVGVEVTSTDGDQVVGAVLADISVGGCQLLFPPEHAPQTGDRLRMKFRLPDSAHRFELAGTVRRRLGSDKPVRCGVEFEVVPARDERELSQYIVRRQRELAAAS